MILLIVNYNQPNFLEVQLPMIIKNMEPEKIHVIDTGEGHCKPIADLYDTRYTHVRVGNKDFSQCHAIGLNIGYAFNRQLTDIIGIMDHDCFPMVPVNVPEKMEGKYFYSSNQERLGMHYPNPACMFMRTYIGQVDFMPCKGMDTAGQLHTVYNQVKEMTFELKADYEVFDETFLHIGKGSNWVKQDDNAARVHRVFEYVKCFK